MSKRSAQTTLRLLSRVPRPRPARVVMQDYVIRRHVDNLQILMDDNEHLARAIITATESWARGRRFMMAHGNKILAFVTLLTMACCE